MLPKNFPGVNYKFSLINSPNNIIHITCMWVVAKLCHAACIFRRRFVLKGVVSFLIFNIRF